MVTIDPVVVANHAQHAQLYAKQLKDVQQHASHDALWTGLALGIVGNAVQPSMGFRLKSFSDAMGALSDRGADIEKRIDATAETFHFVEAANKDLMIKTQNQVQDPDLFHAPKTANDFPDSGLVSDIAGFASNVKQYKEDGGALAVTLGSIACGLDVLGFAFDPVGGMFGTLAGLIIDLVWPLKEILDALAGDPGGLQDASTAFDQIAKLLSETAHTFAASLGEITPRTWDQPGASDVYQTAAGNLVQLAIDLGTVSVNISGDIYMIGSALGDVRASVFEHIMGFVIEACITAATGVAAAGPTLGASIAAAAGVIEAEAVMAGVAVGMEVAAGLLRLGAAAAVADGQAQQYEKLVADIKK